MMQLLFFALRDDVIPLIEAVEASSQLKYVRTGNSRAQDIETFSSALDIPDLGRADFGTASGCASYLVCRKDTPVNVRTIGVGGARRFLVDQLINPDTVVFTPAGSWTNDMLLHGRVATASDTTSAQELMKLFQSAVRKQFTKVQAFYVGPQALTWLHAGKRLTISEQSPRDFDLTSA